MHRHRFLSDIDVYRLPRPAAPAIAPGSFMTCPCMLLQGQTMQQCQWQQYLYQVAFEQAQAQAQPSLLERDLLAVWN
jgi:hypothetical protein